MRILKHYYFFAILIIALSLVIDVSAQGWERTYEGGENTSIATLTNGNFLVTTNLTTNLVGGETEVEAILYEVNLDGDTVWKKGYPDYRIIDTKKSVVPNQYFSIAQTRSFGQLDDFFTLLKFNEQGDTLWSKPFGSNVDISTSIRAIAVTQDSGCIVIINNSTVIGTADSSTYRSEATLIKLDEAGNEQWSKSYDNFNEPTTTRMPGTTPNRVYFIDWLYFNTIVQVEDGGYVIGGSAHSEFPEEGESVLIKVNSLGDELWHTFLDASVGIQGAIVGEDTVYGYNITYDYGISDVIESENGDLIVTGTDGVFDSSLGISSIDHLFIARLSNDGNEIWINTSNDINETGRKVIEHSDGSLFVSGEISNANETGFFGYLKKVSANGNHEIWRRIYSNRVIEINDMVSVSDGGFLIGANGFVPTTGISFESNLYLIKTDSLGISLTNKIEGYVFADFNDNCEQDAINEVGLVNRVVEIEGDETYYAITDSNGFYSQLVNLGIYTIQPVVINDVWENSCFPSIIKNITESNVIDTVHFPIEAAVSCPYMVVDISSPRLRRCFDNTYYVTYTNYGTQVANGAQIDIFFDNFIDVTSSSLNWSAQDGQHYTFDLGDVAVGESGEFRVEFVVNCDSTQIGQTLCARAIISPNDLCTPADPQWDLSSVALSSSCVEDTVQFTITNTGTGNMTESLQYTIIEDVIVFVQEEPFQLESGESTMISIPGNGSTFRLRAPQSAFHPGVSNPTVAVEGCGTNQIGEVSLGFYTMFPEDDEDPFVSEDCQEIVGSYDPNDKQVYPKGVGEEHYIEEGVELEYKIRFQNTGTDTAFTVVIRDELSESLDITTVVPGSSSHPYEMSIDGRTLIFTFNNIDLPDSNVNEPGSNGFVKFRVAQSENNEVGTLIENDAGIYFDFNPPIITNTAFVEVNDDPIVLSLRPNETSTASLKVYPNPFKDYTTIMLPEGERGTIQLEVYDLSGKQLRSQVALNANMIKIDREMLLPGIYFYRISVDGRKVSTGKLSVMLE